MNHEMVLTILRNKNKIEEIVTRYREQLFLYEVGHGLYNSPTYRHGLFQLLMLDLYGFLAKKNGIERSDAIKMIKPKDLLILLKIEW